MHFRAQGVPLLFSPHETRAAYWNSDLQEKREEDIGGGSLISWLGL